MAATPLFASDRNFQIWLYSTSHKTLLLRSNKGDSFPSEVGYPTRIEVVFVNVGFMAVHPWMRGMRITECGAADVPDGFGATSVSGSWYRIEADGLTGFVAAGGWATREDDLEYYDESSFFTVGVRAP